MLTLKQIKSDVQFNLELAGLINVLKGIASSQFRFLQAKREYFLRFNRSITDIFETVSILKSHHPFLEQPAGEEVKTGIVMITSDEGFLGDLNSRIINAGLSLRKQQDELIILGQRGSSALEEQKESFLFFQGLPEEIEHEQAEALSDYLIRQYLERKLHKILIIYPKFISFAFQEINTEQLLPYVPAEEEAEPQILISPKFELLIEPSLERVIDFLVRIWMVQKVYDIFWESKLSELASRAVHLEGSSQAVEELNKKLQFIYFRIIHQLSDKNIREIFASRLIK
jgi:F-type H+-transporting ATPase subunit gamma